MGTKYQEWYNRNKFLFNAKRNKKYRQDTQYRDQCLERQRTYQMNRDGMVERELPDQRKIMVYRVGQLKMFGITVATIKDWETRGLIPVTLFTNSQHRYYTPQQVELLKGLNEVMEEGDETAISRQVDFVSQNWCDGVYNGNENL